MTRGEGAYLTVLAWAALILLARGAHPAALILSLLVACQTTVNLVFWRLR